MDLDEIKEEIAHLRNLKQMHVRRVRVLHLQRAEKGHSCPPEIIIEIEDVETIIQKTDAHIQEKEQQLVDIGKKFSEYRGCINKKSHVGELANLRNIS